MSMNRVAEADGKAPVSGLPLACIDCPFNDVTPCGGCFYATTRNAHLIAPKLPKIIGLSGKVGVGKSAMAGHLHRYLPNSRRMSFAYLLKNEVSCLFSFPRVWCDMDKNRIIPLTMGRSSLNMPRSMTVRELLQWYGTDVIRRHSPDRWVNAMREKLNGVRVDYVIIDDVRFVNEAKLVSDLNGLLVRLEPYAGYERPVKSDGLMPHVSETALDNFRGWDMVFRPQSGPKGVDEGVVRAIMGYVRE